MERVGYLQILTCRLFLLPCYGSAQIGSARSIPDLDSWMGENLQDSNSTSLSTAARLFTVSWNFCTNGSLGHHMRKIYISEENAPYKHE